MLENCICGNEADIITENDGDKILLTVKCDNPECNAAKPICMMFKSVTAEGIKAGVTAGGLNRLKGMWNAEIKSIRAGFKPGEIPVNELLSDTGRCKAL